MNIREVEEYLTFVKDNYKHRISSKYSEFLAIEKKKAVEMKDLETAEKYCCLEMVLKVQDDYISAFNSIKNNEFYEGWCLLERVEISCESLFMNMRRNDLERYKLDFIDKQTEKFQSVFPYEWFISPEIVIGKKKCNICNREISFRNDCGHIAGKIYNGELCYRIVEDIKSFGIALVKNPAQKYSVLFTNNESGEKTDTYNYSVVRFLAERLESPFHGWEVILTKERHPHSRYSNTGRNDKCPCGSGKKYKYCCLNEDGVLRPHYDIAFEVPPPSGLSMMEYSN